MRKGRVTLEAAEDYGRRCAKIGQERRNMADLQDAINHPNFKVRHHNLLDELATEYRQGRSLLEGIPWKTIKLGTHKSIEELSLALLDGGFHIEDWGGDILKGITIASEPKEIKLIKVSVTELGFPDIATLKQIYNRALSLGLPLCPAEVGPQLRLQYPDQPDEDFILVAMAPLTDIIDLPWIFSVGRDDASGLKPWLAGPTGCDGWDVEYLGSADFVFTRK